MTTDPREFTRADMDRAWREGRATRPLYGRDGRGNPDEASPYADVPVPTGDWSVPATYPDGDHCGQCMTPLDLSGDNPETAPWPCERDLLHCGDCADRCPSCRYHDDDRTSLTNTEMLG